MVKPELTDEQQIAVGTRDSSVLVSAAAGSGKTRVIIERLMSYIGDTNNPKDLDSFLIITYTRAAAAELRGRIADELSRRSGLEPENRWLRRQSALCYNADIGTIHSFCTTLIRENCHKLSLSPDFRVGDEESCAILKEKALENVLDAAYENMDSIEGFSDLCGSVGAGRDDSRLSETILELYSKIQSHPYPDEWVEKQIDRLSCRNIIDAADCDWGAELMARGRESTRYWYESLESIWLSICADEEDNEPLIKAYGESIGTSLLQMRGLLNSYEDGWDAVRGKLPIDFPRFKQLRNFPFEDTRDKLISVREDCKKAMKSLNEIFDCPSARLLSQLELTASAMTALLGITLSFGTRYSSEKRRYNLLDFSDLEHFAVDILFDKKLALPSEIANTVSNRYTEIMVDEYQDVNEVQDLIFNCISKNGENIFMVGDVKQSIYRFRLADPSIFMDKYHSFKDIAVTEAGECSRVLLRRNFRSDAAVILACNHVFSEIMSEDLGGIDYDENAALKSPELDPGPRGEVHMTVLAVPQSQDEGERPDKIALEAQMLARRIKELIESGTTVTDKGVERPARFEDIAILLRSPKRIGSIYASALSNYGIPVASENETTFFSSEEIVVCLAFLNVIDNPHRDIALTAVLSSPIFGFLADELSQIRLSDRSSDFYTALSRCSETDGKCRDFVNALAEIRALSRNISVRELISYIYERFELPALWAASDGPKDSEKNLSILSDLALQFEKNGYRGLHSFLAQLKIMEQRGIEPQSSTVNSANCVSIMSIHKSKGLEFPIVFLANSARKFNLQDLSRPVLTHPRLGVGGKVVDHERGVEFPTIAHRAIKSRLLTETLSEEIRVLYVAMTRAKERLYISCTAKDPEDYIKKLSLYKSSPLSPEILRKYPTFADWLILSFLSGGGKAMSLEISHPYEEAEPKTRIAAPITELSQEDTFKLEKLREILSLQYPHGNTQGIPSKLTATMLRTEERDEDAHELVPRRERTFRLPNFSAETRRLTAAERGTAVHTLMQFIDFSLTSTAEEIEKEIARVESLGQLTAAAASAIDVSIVRSFFISAVGKRIKAADSVIREFRFSLLCPANEFFDFRGDEKILLQGIVDCCIEEQGVLTIIDYKTDSVTEDTLAFAAEKYKPQVRAYAYAMERILKKPVASCILCFLSSGLTYEL